MKLALFVLGAVAAQYEYDDFGYKKKKNGASNPFHWKNGETDPCGCTNTPRNSPDAFGVCNMTATELANLPSNKQKVQRAHVRIWWTCPRTAEQGGDVSVLYTDRCKRLKKRPLSTTFPEWPSPCGDISGSCKCQNGMTTLMSEAAWAGASFECIDDGRKHSTYRITCADGTTSAEGRVKCKNNFVRRMNGDLRNFSCAGRGNKRG
ncbi:Oidioi.mRNA.OKI2018_I69.PAR.g11236.t1.cds [Oikopleura dioica]|uniref:Oidioi.mRNA.OKI2018_I69.PAR.g11236.t1.cds n=1 Tax=Oikopleura dioica TaxID=34765 RepID=A0ABN7RZ25_OIKDI|nr:Oidioi.mRNA.OKI2018_I69.PAR.g11236.t1.cds [Oikopleura dioica]